MVLNLESERGKISFVMLLLCPAEQFLQGGLSSGFHAVLENRLRWRQVRRDFSSHRRRHIAQDTEQEKSQDGRQVQAKQRWQQSAKDIQVGVGNGVDGLQ